MAGTAQRSTFRPPRWLRNPHAQTLRASVLRRAPRPPLWRQRFTLPDGDFVDLDWLPPRPGRALVIVLHGLEGSSRSPYAAGLLARLHGAGLNAVLMHFRGCSGVPNRRPRSYHAGDTGDLAALVAHLRRVAPQRPLLAVGYSLGGNALLRWLGETGPANPLRAAAAVSVPYRLADAARRLQRGLSRLYQAHLLRRLKAGLRRRAAVLDLPVDVAAALRARDFFEFDDRVTAPLHGFAGVADYYRRASCRDVLRHIAVPTLLLHALDDPFLFPDTMPGADELAAPVRLEWSPHGGHVGFYARQRGARWWLEALLLNWLLTAEAGGLSPSSGASHPGAGRG